MIKLLKLLLLLPRHSCSRMLLICIELTLLFIGSHFAIIWTAAASLGLQNFWHLLLQASSSIRSTLRMHRGLL